MFHKIDLNLLVYLDVLLEVKNISLASKHLNLSQPALSNALKRLRNFYNDPLLVKSGRTMILTLLAKQIKDPLRKYLTHIKVEVLQTKTFDPHFDSFCFKFAFHGYEEFLILPKLLKVLHDYPRLSICNDLPKSPHVVDELANGQIHFTTTPCSWIKDHSYIMQRKILEDPFVILASQSHPHDTWTTKEYLDEDHLLIAPHGSTNALVDCALKKKGLKRRIKVAIGEFSATGNILIQNPTIVTTVPFQLAKQLCLYYPLKTATCPIDLPPLEIFLSWHKSSLNLAPLIWFKDQFIKSMTI